MLKGAALTALATILAAGAAAAQDAAGGCAALADMRLDATNLLSAAEVPAGDELPAYCRVLGYVRPAINFEVRLPSEGWNGKFYMAGCGGFCGTVLSESKDTFNAINHALARGYAVATSDGGHWGTGSTDARWARDNPVAEADWGWRSVEETTRVAKALTEAYFDAAPEHSYFQGCSTGGRQANMAAIRTPEAFDGIISGAPALDYPGLVATAFAWVVQANTGPDGAQILTPEDAPVVAEAVSAACDGADGVEDGVISAPDQCDWTPAKLACEAGQDEGCLSPQKVAVLEKWYAPAAAPDGTVLYPAGVPLSSEPFWGLWLTGLPEGGGRVVPAFGQNFLRYMAFPEDPAPDYTAMDFDFAADPARLEPAAALYNSDDPDLSAFRDAGGKILVYHGLADAVVFPGKSVDWFEALGETTEGADEFARLFLIPGFDHCGIQGSGPGVDQRGIDPLTALEAWVERGEAPDALPSVKMVDGAEAWARPVCAYPATARFSGDGDWRDAAGWTCEAAE